MAKTTDELCPRCFIGRLEAGHASYLALFQGQMVTIPNVVAYTCDICDYREYDDTLVAWVSGIAGVTADNNVNLLNSTLQSKFQPPKP